MLSHKTVRWIPLILLLLMWAFFSRVNQTFHLFNPILLPSPTDVFVELWNLFKTGKLVDHIQASLIRVILGFLLGAGLGLFSGLLAGAFRPVQDMVEPIVELLRPIPPLALLPMMVLWFGIAETSKVIFIGYTSFFPVFITTMEGIKNVDPLLIRAALTLGASRKDLFWKVMIPASFPQIITGLRLSIGLSFFVIVAAEFVAADRGLGFLINDGRNFFLMPQMMGAAIVIGILGYSINTLVKKMERRLLQWREDQ